ncbi:hypothetical protein Q8A67_002548 [Cirrhinus molitorella]|uniref:Uncharacterized protein n=1 Tax=Cirrhinus molitorella TaxID=172907 RepID=A0AA88QLM2_9TELE|nr:hypothetical protein Q8A67_002548 [Cirrhinus molitorella]
MRKKTQTLESFDRRLSVKHIKETQSEGTRQGLPVSGDPERSSRTLHGTTATGVTENVVQHNFQPTECSHWPRNIKNRVCVSVYKTDWQERQIQSQRETSRKR